MFAKKMQPSRLVESVGGSYANQLGIDLSRAESAEIYKWLVASMLFGARITERIAARTYREFAEEGILSPQKIVHASRDTLVKILDRGGYARYDFKTAAKLQDVGRGLLAQYGGDLNNLHRMASDAQDLEWRLMALGKGIGNVTVNIFLRELRGIWPKASPALSYRAIEAAKALKFIPASAVDPAAILHTLKDAWLADHMAAKSFLNFEAALVRYDAMLRRKITT
jgi:hypothetical protein